jgi:hypothetical protein
MPIAGLTGRPKEFSTVGRIDISVFKGRRKTATRAGTDLETHLRIATTNPTAAKILREYYGEPDGNGDFLTETINVYLGFDDVNKTFWTGMRKFSASGLELECDRHTIYKRCIPYTDDKGNRWRPVVDVQEVCPMRDKGFSGDCPNECVKEGRLTFFIKEILDQDLMLPVKLTVHGYTDITHIDERLPSLFDELGSLTTSPFPSILTRNKIPFVLSRVKVRNKRPGMKENGQDARGKKLYKRTGTKSDDWTWAIDIQCDPYWMELRRKWQLVQELRSYGRQLPGQTIASLLNGDASTVIDVEATTVAEPLALPTHSSTVEIESVSSELLSAPASDRYLNNPQLDLLENLFEQNEWDEESVSAMLQREFEVAELNELKADDYEKVYAIASSPQRITVECWTQEIEPVFRQNGWFLLQDGKEKMMAAFLMLQSEYGITRLGEIYTSQIPEVLEFAANHEVRDRWLNLPEPKPTQSLPSQSGD